MILAELSKKQVWHQKAEARVSTQGNRKRPQNLAWGAGMDEIPGSICGPAGSGDGIAVNLS
jgi:hypothetical protein